MTNVAITINYPTKVYAMAIQPFNVENNAALWLIVSAITSSIVCANVLSGTLVGHKISSKDLMMKTE